MAAVNEILSYDIERGGGNERDWLSTRNETTESRAIFYETYEIIIIVYKRSPIKRIFVAIERPP